MLYYEQGNPKKLVVPDAFIERLSRFSVARLSLRERQVRTDCRGADGWIVQPRTWHGAEVELNLYHRGTNDRLRTHEEKAEVEANGRPLEAEARQREAEARQREAECRKLAEEEVKRLRAELAKYKQS